MKKIVVSLLILGVALLAGCRSEVEVLPSEDLEVFKFYPELIRTLQNPNLSPSSKEKYEAAHEIIKKVDFTFTREAKTLNDIFYHGDAMIDPPNNPEHTISFNYQYGDRYVRLRFFMYRNFVTRVEITDK